MCGARCHDIGRHVNGHLLAHGALEEVDRASAAGLARDIARRGPEIRELHIGRGCARADLAGRLDDPTRLELAHGV